MRELSENMYINTQGVLMYKEEYDSEGRQNKYMIKGVADMMGRLWWKLKLINK